MRKFSLLCLLLFIQIVMRGQVSGDFFDTRRLYTLIEMQSGNIQNLELIDTVNVVFDYSSFGVDAYKTETDFLENMKLKYASKSEKWALFLTNWERGKKEVYPKSFVKTFNRLAPHKLNMAATLNDTTKQYTLEVKPSYMLICDPDVKCEFSSIDAEFIFKNSSGRELARFYCKNVFIEFNKLKKDFTLGIGASFSRSAKVLISGIRKQQY